MQLIKCLAFVPAFALLKTLGEGDCLGADVVHQTGEFESAAGRQFLTAVISPDVWLNNVWLNNVW